MLATTKEELTATLDNFNSCPSPGVTSDMWNTLKISITSIGVMLEMVWFA